MPIKLYYSCSLLNSHLIKLTAVSRLFFEVFCVIKLWKEGWKGLGRDTGACWTVLDMKVILGQLICTHQLQDARGLKQMYFMGWAVGYSGVTTKVFVVWSMYYVKFLALWHHVKLITLGIPSLGHLQTFESVYLLIHMFSVKMQL